MNALESSAHERRHIGAFTAASMLVGMVVGVSIFILPGELAATAGPGVLLAYTIAGGVALIGCLVAAEVGAVLPVSGASFVMVSRCLSPFAGFVGLWMTLGAISMAMALLAYGFADYFALLVPGMPPKAIALGIVALLGALNVLGTRTALLSQNVFVLLMMAALLVFCILGAPHVDMANLTPFLPRGADAAVAAAVPAFFSFTGFMLIMEIGGEVKTPGRTIPVAVLAAFAVVLVTYLAVAFVVVGVEHWSRLAGVTAPVGVLAQRFMPHWGADLITATALLATLTSLNGILLGYARDILAVARAGLLPSQFARLNARGEPVWAMSLMTVLSLLAVIGGATVLEYATATVVAAMLLQMLLAIAVWRMPRVLAAEYEAAAFRLPRGVRGAVIVAMFSSSGYLMWRGVRDAPEMLGALVAFGAAGALYYAARAWWMGGSRHSR